MFAALSMTGILGFIEFIKSAVFVVGYIQGSNLFPEPLSSEEEKKYFVNYFKDKTVSHHNVIEEFCRLRGVKNVEDIKKDK